MFCIDHGLGKEDLNPNQLRFVVSSFSFTPEKSPLKHKDNMIELPESPCKPKEAKLSQGGLFGTSGQLNANVTTRKHNKKTPKEVVTSTSEPMMKK